MAICQQPLSQFVASDPQPALTSKNNPRFHDRIVRQHHGREPDGSFAELGPALVACRAAGEAFCAGPAGDDERRD